MRTIKCRGKRLDNGEWAVGSLLITDDNKNNPMQLRIPKKRCQIVEYCAGDWNMGGWDYADVDPSTVGQFTGLTDKNGKEIYEGDVIEVVGVTGTTIPCGNYASDYHTVGAKLLVKWFPAGFMLTDNKFNECSTVGNVKQYDFWNKTRSLIVIGNIHDNPNCLKTNKP